MKVLVGTDFHGVESAFEGFASKAEEEKADILVVCGDITPFGTLQQAERLLSILASLRLPLLFVPGNCDPPSLAGVDVEGAECIHGKSVYYGDVTFMGVGGSSYTPFDTPFELAEEEIMDTLNRGWIDHGSRWTVLVSHEPPRDTRVDRTFSGMHVGSPSVRRFVEEKKPSIVFCGHIHEARGKDKINDTIIVNPGAARHGNYAEALFDEEITIRLSPL